MDETKSIKKIDLVPKEVVTKISSFAKVSNNFRKPSSGVWSPKFLFRIARSYSFSPVKKDFESVILKVFW